jgi:hypothetical protein
MSRTMWVYFASVLVMWIPAALAVRRGLDGRLSEHVLCGLLMAVVWPIAVPALSWTALKGRSDA